MSKNGFQKLKNGHFDQKSEFFDQNTHKIEANGPRDLKLGLKNS